MGKEIVVNVLVNSVICDSGDFYITKNAQPCVRCVALAAFAFGKSHYKMSPCDIKSSIASATSRSERLVLCRAYAPRYPSFSKAEINCFLHPLLLPFESKSQLLSPSTTKQPVAILRRGPHKPYEASIVTTQESSASCQP